jgi:hypothetical protein
MARRSTSPDAIERYARGVADARITVGPLIRLGARGPPPQTARRLLRETRAAGPSDGRVLGGDGDGDPNGSLAWRP